MNIQAPGLTVVFILFLHPLFAQNSDFQIDFQRETRMQKLEGGKTFGSDFGPEYVLDTLTVRLFENQSFRTSEGKKGVFTDYDLDTERIVTYDADSIYSIVPLYHVIDYRTSEYQNRTFLANMLSKAGAPNGFGDLASQESMFGLEFEENEIRNQIKSKSKKDTLFYSFEKKSLCKILLSKEKVPQSYLNAFSRFLTYEIGIHPFIKEEILKSKRIPGYIGFSHINVATKMTYTYQFLAAGKMEHNATGYDLKNPFSKGRDGSTMGGLIDSVLRVAIQHPVKSVDSTVYFTKSEELAAEGQNTSAILCLFEYLLSTGQQPISRIRTIADLAETDTVLATFLYCLGDSETKEDAEEKIALYRTLLDLDLEYGYIMNIFLANKIQPIDEHEAEANFHLALTHNPYITGVWLDLGKIYANQYIFEEAWKCFDIMLRIHPKHPMAAELWGKMEYLKTEFPQYFKTE